MLIQVESWNGKYKGLATPYFPGLHEKHKRSMWERGVNPFEQKHIFLRLNGVQPTSKIHRNQIWGIDLNH